MDVGKRIKERRKELNMSVDELAQKLNKNRTTVYRYEKGDIENLPMDILGPLAEVLNTTPAYLMGWDNKPTSAMDTITDYYRLSIGREDNIRVRRIDYREELTKTRNALRILEDDSVDAKTKNRYLKTIISKMVYERDPNVRISKENAEQYGFEISKGLRYYTPPYKITIELKCD